MKFPLHCYLQQFINSKVLQSAGSKAVVIGASMVSQIHGMSFSMRTFCEDDCKRANTRKKSTGLPLCLKSKMEHKYTITNLILQSRKSLHVEYKIIRSWLHFVANHIGTCTKHVILFDDYKF